MPGPRQRRRSSRMGRRRPPLNLGQGKGPTDARRPYGSGDRQGARIVDADDVGSRTRMAVEHRFLLARSTSSPAKGGTQTPSHPGRQIVVTSAGPSPDGKPAGEAVLRRRPGGLRRCRRHDQPRFNRGGATRTAVLISHGPVSSRERATRLAMVHRCPSRTSAIAGDLHAPPPEGSSSSTPLPPTAARGITDHNELRVQASAQGVRPLAKEFNFASSPSPTPERVLERKLIHRVHRVGCLY